MYRLLLVTLLLLPCACDDATPAADASSDARAADGAVEAALADADASDGLDVDADATAGDGTIDAPPAPDAGPWTTPTCTQITGMAGVTFSSDEGQTLTPTAGMLSGVAYTMGIVALARGNTLVAQHGDALWRSVDSGCTWRELGKSGLLELAASGDVTYGWGDNRDELWRIDGSTPTKLTSPTPNIHGLGVDRQNPKRLRIGADGGVIYESTDGGASFSQLLIKKGDVPSVLNYRVAFDPADLDHLAYGVANDGLIVSSDGGKSWTKATGLTTSARANIFSVAFSPAQSNVVWAMGLDPTELNAKRKIFRSIDGGKTFVKVVDEAGTIPMSNGTELWPHPQNPDLLYFAHGSKFSGARLMRYDHSSGMVTSTTNTFHGIDALAFNPSNPSLLYIGLDWKDFL
ncbi:MAG: hypothetical protein KC503_46920 [Myxococcales bacterium]|nr:hypothetical protein [Myxococcales bacterium]